MKCKLNSNVNKTIFNILNCLCLFSGEMAGEQKKRAQKDLTLAAKFDVVDYSEKHPMTKQADMCKKFGIPQSTLSGILKNKTNFKQRFMSGQNSTEMKGHNTHKHMEIEKALLDWFPWARSNNSVIDGNILREKANELLRLNGENGGEISASWIDGKSDTAFRLLL